MGKLSRKKPQLGLLRGQGLKVVPLQRGLDLQKGQGTYKEALANIKIATIKENYHEDKLKDDE
jgi:hypothetical protein